MLLHQYGSHSAGCEAHDTCSRWGFGSAALISSSFHLFDLLQTHQFDCNAPIISDTLRHMEEHDTHYFFFTEISLRRGLPYQNLSFAAEQQVNKQENLCLGAQHRACIQREDCSVCSCYCDISHILRYSWLGRQAKEACIQQHVAGR